MKAITLHLLRHGVPERADLLLGQRDDAPLPSGAAQCVARAGGLSIGRVVSSDLVRAARPAAEIAAARGLAHEIDPRWRELDFGAWTGLAAAQVEPQAMARFWDDPEASPPPGGERWSQLCARIGAALAQVTSDTLVVTHGGAMRAALAQLFHMEQRHVWAFDLPYASLISLRLWPGAGASGGDGNMPTAQITGLST